MKMDRAAVMAALANGQTVFDKVDFTGEDLSSLRFLATTFKHCTFEGADITDTGFIDSDIRFCNMKVAGLRKTALPPRFNRCVLNYVTFEGAQLGNTVFYDCMMDDIALGGSILDGVMFEQCLLSNASLTKSDGTLAVFDDATTFKNCTLIKSSPPGLKLYVPAVVKAAAYTSYPATSFSSTLLPPIQIGDAVAKGPPSPNELSGPELKVLNMQTTRRTCAKCERPLRGTWGFTYCGVCEKD